MTGPIRILGLVALFVLLCGGNVFAQVAKPQTPPATTPRDFDKTGPQVGEQVPDLRLHTMKGEEQRLSAAWSGGPALLVTSSLTCPKSRSRWPELKELVAKYEDKLNIVIVYVIEAHPVGSVCPYKDIEDITPENQRDGILRKQPKTLEDRLELAQEFKRLLRINAPIYVDNMKDEAWKGLGAAPNLALVVDDKGIVAARSGWFEGKKSQEAIDKYLQAKKEKDEKEKKEWETKQKLEESRRNGESAETPGSSDNVAAERGKSDFDYYDFLWAVKSSEQAEDLARMLKAAPEAAKIEIEPRQGHHDHSTVLMDAVLAKNAAGVKLLLEYGADVKVSTETYDSALQIAARMGDLSIVKMLLAKGADPAFPATGKSPLHEAAVHGHPEIVKLLLSKGLRHDFYSAIALGEIEMIRKGLQADPSRALRPDGASRMPMDYAAANGQIEIAKLLVARGAPMVHDRGSSIETPLQRAINHDDAAMTEWLLAAGTSPDTSVGRGGEYRTSLPTLHLAVARKNLALVKILLAHKADLTVRDTYSQTALHDAASAGQAEIVAALLQAGADVNIPQLGYETPCGSGSEKAPSYTTPLHFAASGTDPATIKVLIAGGAKVNAVTKDGKTPLMSSVSARRYAYEKEEGSRLANVELLLASGAEINAEDHEGRSVLDIATTASHGDDTRSKQDHEEMLALLKKHGAKTGSGVRMRAKPAAPGLNPPSLGPPPFSPPPFSPPKVPGDPFET